MCVAAVSYTHLDVYKRQVDGLGRIVVKTAVVIVDESADRRTVGAQDRPNIGRSLAVGDGDVYKRQPFYPINYRDTSNSSIRNS